MEDSQEVAGEFPIRAASLDGLNHFQIPQEAFRAAHLGDGPPQASRNEFLQRENRRRLLPFGGEGQKAVERNGVGWLGDCQQSFHGASGDAEDMSG